MKLIYIANYRLPTEKAHGVQIAKMCESLAMQKVGVSLFVPRRRNHIRQNIYDYYSVMNNFDVKYFDCIDLVGIIPKLGFWLQSITFARAVNRYLGNYEGVVYSRDLFSLWEIKKRKKAKLIYEMHNFPKQITEKHSKIFKRIDKFVVISQGLKKELVNFGIDESKILLSRTGVDYEKFANLPDKKTSRHELKIKQDAKVVMYTGHLYSWKGVDTVIKAAHKLPDHMFYFVGGTKRDIAKYSKYESDNIVFTGHKKYKDIPKYISAADILVLPNSAKEKISSHYTSPLKLFEYMASGKAIVASKLPSIEEILNEENSVLVEADSSEALVDGILVANSDLGVQAKKDAKQYDWSNRAQAIIKFIS